jgi:hypothetical protein
MSDAMGKKEQRRKMIALKKEYEASLRAGGRPTNIFPGY